MQPCMCDPNRGSREVQEEILDPGSYSELWKSTGSSDYRLRGMGGSCILVIGKQ